MEANDQLEDVVKKSREFLHELSNQLVIIQGMGGLALTKLKNDPLADEGTVNKLEKVAQASKKMNEMIKSHRSFLLESSK